MSYFNPQPKPGKKKKKLRGVSPEKLKKVYSEVLERDNYLCQNPGCKNGHPLSPPHHVRFRSQGGEDLSENLISLCIHCHDLIHARGLLKVSGVYPDFKFVKID